MGTKVVSGYKHSIPPLPRTERGFGIHIDGNTFKGNKLLYTNENNVIIRSLDDQFESKIFCGHKCRATVARFSPNGEWIASGDCQGNVITWGVGNKIIKDNMKVNRCVLDIAWGEDNSQIAAFGEGSNGVYGKVFRLGSTNAIGEIDNHSNKILSCAMRPKRPYLLATASEDTTVNFYKGVPYRFQTKKRVHTKYVNCIKFSPDGEKIASVGSDSAIFIYDANGEVLSKCTSENPSAHKGSIYSCAFSPDSTKLLSVGGDKTAKLWDVESMQCEGSHTFGKSVEDMQVACLWLEDYVISVSLSGDINFLDIDDFENRLKSTWTGHKENINSILTIAEKSLLLSSCDGGNIVAWKPSFENGEERHESFAFRKKHGGKPVTAMSFSYPSNKLFSVGFDDCLRVFTMTEETNIVKFDLIEEYQTQFKNQPKCLVAGKNTEDLAAVGTSLKSLFIFYKGELNEQSLKYMPTCMDFSPDDSLLVIGSNDKTFYIYNRNKSSFELIKTVKNHPSILNNIKFYSEGDYLVSVCEKKAFLWDTSDFSKPINLRGYGYHNAKVNEACFEKELNALATCGNDENVNIWPNPKDERKKRSKRLSLYPVHIGSVTAIKNFAVENNNLFVTVGRDRFIRFWEWNCLSM